MFDFQAQIERLFQKITWIQLVCAASLTVVLLVLAEVFVRLMSGAGTVVISPTNPAPYLVRWNDRDNPDSFKRLKFEALKPEDSFTVAWIAASGILVRRAPDNCTFAGSRRYSQPQVLSKKFRTVDGKPIRVEEYFQAGMGAYDLRRAALNAIESKDTDAVIMEMNPIVFLNDLNVFGHSRQRADILFQKEARAYDYLISLPAINPSDAVLAALGQVSELVRQRGSSPLIVNQAIVPFPTFSPDPKAKPAQKPKSIFALLRPKLKLTPMQNRYRRLFYQPNTENGSIAADIVINTFADLKNSGKKVLIYVPPFNTNLRDKPEIAGRIREIQDRLLEMAAPFTGDDFIVRSDTGLADLGRLEYNDFIHFSCGIGEMDMVADMISRLVGGNVNMRPNSHIYGKRAGKIQ